MNSYTTGPQTAHSVGSDSSGNFVVVWESFDGGFGNGIFGQRFDSAGAALGGEFGVNSYTPGSQTFASVASDASGNFVVVWTDFSGQDGSTLGIFGQRYDSEGTRLGGEFQINTYTRDRQLNPSVAFDASGSFVVVWQGYGQDGSHAGIFGQRYDSGGVPQGSEFRVNSYTTNGQFWPDVASDGSGNFVVVWASYGQDGSGYGVFGQRYDFGGGGETIHSGDLDGRGKNAGANWRARVRVEVHDSVHALASGALVSFFVTGSIGTLTCTTNASGVCNVQAQVADSTPSLTFSITDISKAGFTYDPGANHDPDGSSDGTTIVVNQP